MATGRTMAAWMFVAMLGLASAARAEPVKAISAAPTLSERDGSVRAQAGLRFAVTPARGAPGDHAVAIGERLQKQLPKVRRCYRTAVTRNAALDGVVVARLQNVQRGGRKVRLVDNDTHDRGFARCVLRSIARTRLAGLPRGAAARVEVGVHAPGAAMKQEMAKRSAQARAVRVRRARDGNVETEGGTQGGEVQFSLQSKPGDRAALVALHQSVADRLAGLLDCRRRATRRGKTPRGTLVFDVKTERSGVERVRTVKNPFRNPKASACVNAWLRRGEPSALSRGQVRLSLSYGP